MNVVITGCCGNMGLELVRYIYRNTGFVIIGGIEELQSKYHGKDLGEIAFLGDKLHVNVRADLNEIITVADCVLDFSTTYSSIEYLDICVKNKVPIVIGTTGFSDNQEKMIEEASKHIPIAKSANMSMGFTIMSKLIELATVLTYDSNFDIEILEKHHKNRTDLPATSAIMLAKEISKTKQVSYDNTVHHQRKSGLYYRSDSEVGISAIRGGGSTGEHCVMFLAPNESIEITHKALSNYTFCQGAVSLANWLVKKQFGLYNMNDLINYQKNRL